MTTCAAIIVGIDGWEQYTLPLIQSLIDYDGRGEIPSMVAVIDNASQVPYRREDIRFPQIKDCYVNLKRSEKRLCYSAAINLGHEVAHEWNRTYGPPDWYIVLSNDVLCTGPFARILAEYDDANVVGPQLWHEHGLDWIVGWCVAIPARAWNTVGGWDEGYVMSSVEDVDFSHSARRAGFGLVEDTRLPFTHLDQRQRFGLPGYAGSEAQNWQHFAKKHGMVTA